MDAATAARRTAKPAPRAPQVQKTVVNKLIDKIRSI
jgi:hypothetical protein